jgi:hypothetical protein
MNERVAESIMREKQPETLSAAKLDLKKEPLRRAPVACPVNAWVRYEGVPLQVASEAVALRSGGRRRAANIDHGLGFSDSDALKV